MLENEALRNGKATGKKLVNTLSEERTMDAVFTYGLKDLVYKVL